MRQILKEYTRFLNSLGYLVPIDLAENFTTYISTNDNYPAKVINSILVTTGITELQLKSRVRFREIVDARAIAMYLIRMNTEISIVAIGNLFNRDHSTVLYSIKQVENYLKLDKKFQQKFNLIVQELNK